jgi:hypothetical protein
MIRKIRRSKVFKATVWMVLINMVFDSLFPLGAYALTTGPSSPEFSSFSPVATTDMVDPFSGDFSYNLPVIDIPGPHGSGYALSLAYDNITSPEQEASWVGFGWHLNPGYIII